MNKNGKKISRRYGVFIISVLLLLVLYGLYPKQAKTVSNSVQQSSHTQDQHLSHDTPQKAENKFEDDFRSISQLDTATNCQLQFNASQRLIINEQTRNCFEYFISQYGERNINEIRHHFQLYLVQHFQAAQQQQILALWTRYLDYRQKLAQLQVDQPTQENVDYFQSVFNAMHDLKQHFFSSMEIQGLFGTEDIYQQYMLDRMKILEDAKLSEAAKAQRLQQRFDQLPQQWQENLKALSQLEDLRALTAQIQARHGSAQELRNMRVSRVGEAATRRLEQLDQQRSDWKQRVQHYLNERQSILDSNMSSSAKVQSIQKIQQQQFQSVQEQRRLQTFETVYDQGGTLPFSN
ncbi:lipase secretion chaperone [Acinetobacter sp. NIPH 2699]|uniref:lipase secretion chaperone n=1 Tax=Acinetobacter sp. NIPH 2699 TaxID=2923433 RepID=UPI001F4BADDF|nr:lipase secretion chaperone [Acinetobacter sp. NIPH 2699]MCH7335866.1 lipase secretion chaperone [Acinetobacter sp. NIPH 2699]